MTESAVPIDPCYATARPLLFVHGWWGGGWVWDLFRESFSEFGYQSSAIDLRGSLGEIGAGIGEITTAEHLDELRRAVLALNDPIVIGHSFGGLLIQKLAEERDFPAAVLICPAPPKGIFSLRSWGLVRTALRYVPCMLGRREFLPARRDMLRLNLNRLSHEQQDLVLSRMVPASGLQAWETAVIGVRVDATRVRTPMMVMVGSEDRLTTPAVCRAIARKYGAAFREYPGNAHYLMREPNHREIAADVHRWLCQTLAHQPTGATRR